MESAPTKVINTVTVQAAGVNPRPTAVIELFVRYGEGVVWRFPLTKSFRCAYECLEWIQSY